MDDPNAAAASNARSGLLGLAGLLQTAKINAPDIAAKNLQNQQTKMNQFYQNYFPSDAGVDHSQDFTQMQPADQQAVLGSYKNAAAQAGVPWNEATAVGSYRAQQYQRNYPTAAQTALKALSGGGIGANVSIPGGQTAGVATGPGGEGSAASNAKGISGGGATRVNANPVNVTMPGSRTDVTKITPQGVSIESTGTSKPTMEGSQIGQSLNGWVWDGDKWFNPGTSQQETRDVQEQDAPLERYQRQLEKVGGYYGLKTLPGNGENIYNPKPDPTSQPIDPNISGMGPSGGGLMGEAAAGVKHMFGYPEASNRLDDLHEMLAMSKANIIGSTNPKGGVKGGENSAASKAAEESIKKSTTSPGAMAQFIQEEQARVNKLRAQNLAILNRHQVTSMEQPPVSVTPPGGSPSQASPGAGQTEVSGSSTANPQAGATAAKQPYTFSDWGDYESIKNGGNGAEPIYRGDQIVFKDADGKLHKFHRKDGPVRPAASAPTGGIGNVSVAPSVTPPR